MTLTGQMKMMQVKHEDGSPMAVLTYEGKTTPESLTEIIYMMLDEASLHAGFRLKHDLYEISEEIKTVEDGKPAEGMCSVAEQQANEAHNQSTEALVVAYKALEASDAALREVKRRKQCTCEG